ncbi:hypothetical protein LTR36_004721 [Oleoguttula mirabilis]|uniref:Protein kinase domain-containing protein n=1 Tax=Oleoguttula mirabilis TaxID=1507867 RepID=A0AAV9JGC5_9PEZI|nr:hypothetical protein LTR36_004721 [Oleoguttula mirabilis]
MADDQAYWQTFLAWERKVCGKTPSQNSARQVLRELEQQWQRMPNQEAYTAFLRDVNDSQRQVDAAYQAGVITNGNPVQAEQSMEGALQHLLDQLRKLLSDLLNFEAEQYFMDEQGRMSGNQRSRDYTAKLFGGSRSAITDAQIEIGACREAREQLKREERVAFCREAREQLKREEREATCREAQEQLKREERVANLKSPHLYYEDESVHGSVADIGAGKAARSDEPPTQKTQSTDLSQQAGNNNPPAAGGFSDQQEGRITSQKKSTSEKRTERPELPHVTTGRSGKRERPFDFGRALAKKLEKRAKLPAIPALAARLSAQLGKHDAARHDAVKSPNGAPLVDDQQSLEDGVQKPLPAAASADIGAQVNRSHDSLYSLTPTTSEAPRPASFEISESSSHESEEGSKLDDHVDGRNLPDEDVGNTRDNPIRIRDDPVESTDALGTLQQPPRQQDGGVVDDETYQPPASSDRSRRTSPRFGPAGRPDPGAAAGGKKIAAAPGAPGGDDSGDGSEDSRKRKAHSKDSSPRRRKKGRNSSSSSSDDTSDGAKTPRESVSHGPAIDGNVSSAHVPSDVPEVRASAHAGASKPPATSGSLERLFRSVTPERQTPPTSYRPQSPGIPEARIGYNDAPEAPKVDRAKDTPRVRTVDEFRELIYAEGGAMLEYYKQAVAEGRQEQVILEHEVLAIMMVIADDSEPGANRDWAKEEPIRARCPSRQRISSSHGHDLRNRKRAPGDRDTRNPRKDVQPPPAPPMPAAPANKVQAAMDIGFDGSYNERLNEGQWELQEVLGQGGFGIASLWTQRNENGIIIDRAAVKDTYLEPRQWDSPVYWSDMRDPRIAREAAIQETLSDLRYAQSIIKYLSTKVYLDRHMYRIFMEYCPLGTLEDLIWKHNRQQQNRFDNGQPADAIPGLAIWSTFEILAQAACFLESGALPYLPAPQDWQGPIVHRDIKPRNILLTHGDGIRWPGVPAAKLGDFGLAIHESTDDFRNPHDLIGAGTRGMKAPEQVSYDDANFSNKHKLGSATNIFGIGKTMLNLMSTTTDHDARALQAGYDQPNRGRVDIPEKVLECYPERLSSLVRRCLEPNPGHRIKAARLLLEITQIVQEYDGDFGAVPMKFQRLDEDDIIWAKNDMYQKFTR